MLNKILYDFSLTSLFEFGFQSYYNENYYKSIKKKSVKSKRIYTINTTYILCTRYFNY